MNTTNTSRFFTNYACEYYPCHEMKPGEALNCLFCYCPLYPLKADCGGTCTVLPGGLKDCSSCIFPHRGENYDELLRRLKQLVENSCGEEPERQS